jgi:hypothetical protein
MGSFCISRQELIILAGLAVLVVFRWQEERSSLVISHPSSAVVAEAPSPRISEPHPIDCPETILSELNVLEETDQRGLEVLFRKMRDWIRADPASAEQFFYRRVREFPDSPLEETFFLIHSFLQFSPEPERPLKFLLDYEVSRIASPVRHLATVTSAQRMDQVKSFALRHFPREQPAGAVLLPQLKELASQSPSLDVAREAIRLVRHFSSYPESDVDAILRSRAPLDRPVLE